MICTFQNDNYVSIQLPDHPKSHTFATRDHHEVLFRRISMWLINTKCICKNIIDLGAWIGDNTIPWAKNTSGIVYGIDPSYDNCSFIQSVCNLNNISNVTIFQTAISDKDEQLSTNGNIDHCSFLDSGQTIVSATSLDSLFRNGKIIDIDYVHLDVEGMEYKVLQGMSTIIHTYKPIIAFEQHLNIDNITEICGYLKSKNYIVCMINEILPGCREDCRNFIAFPQSEKFESVIKYLRSYFGNSNIFTRF